MMTTRTRRIAGLVGVLAFAGAASMAGVSLAGNGYGVGDGTGPIGVEPQDGTGEQHHGPPLAATASSDATMSVGRTTIAPVPADV